jgi:hypothetical protein
MAKAYTLAGTCPPTPFGLATCSAAGDVINGSDVEVAGTRHGAAA